MSDELKGGWIGKLSEAGVPLYEALTNLLDCPEAFRPFVIIEVMGEGNVAPDGAFAQFAGSTERGLLFDCPPLDVFAEVVVAARLDLCRVGCDLVFVALRKQGAGNDSVVRVRFESSRGPARNPAQA